MPLPVDIVSIVRQILATRGFSLHRLSMQSAEIFGRSSPFYIPHSLYSRLMHLHPAPAIEQFLALSHITNYRFPDWLAVFGFDLDRISGIRPRFTRRRTTLLDSEVYNTQAWIPWFAERPEESHTSIAPIGQLLAPGSAKRAWQIAQMGATRFLYAQIGNQDIYALPYFSPGSVVRADPRSHPEWSLREAIERESRFFLVEDDRGWTCSQILRTAVDKVVLYSAANPCVRRELRLGSEGHILGVVDAEVRLLFGPSRSAPKLGLASLLRSRSNAGFGRPARPGDLFRQARLRAGLSFREASLLSRSMAAELSDDLFFLAAGTLSDYETLSQFPRHLQKILTLCVLYGIAFETCFRALGLPLDRAGSEPIPDELMPRSTPTPNWNVRRHDQTPSKAARFLELLLEEWEEVPLFLRHSLEALAGLKRFSMSDGFWVGGEKYPLHPWLANAALISVNRRARSPASSPETQICLPPLYLILMRDGTYRCGGCTREKGQLVLHAYPGGEGETQEFREGVDAEVIGRVTAILRKLP